MWSGAFALGAGLVAWLCTETCSGGGAAGEGPACFPPNAAPTRACPLPAWGADAWVPPLPFPGSRELPLPFGECLPWENLAAGGGQEAAGWGCLEEGRGKTRKVKFFLSPAAWRAGV